jgi:hypothetical protein
LIPKSTYIPETIPPASTKYIAPGQTPFATQKPATTLIPKRTQRQTIAPVSTIPIAPGQTPFATEVPMTTIQEETEQQPISEMEITEQSNESEWTIYEITVEDSVNDSISETDNMSESEGNAVVKRKKRRSETGFYVASCLSVAVVTVAFLRLMYLEHRRFGKKFKERTREENSLRSLISCNSGNAVPITTLVTAT